MQEEANEIESIGFVGCYTTQLKAGIYAVMNISIEISMHIQIFVPMKAPFFLKGIQKFWLNYQNDNLENFRGNF